MILVDNVYGLVSSNEVHQKIFLFESSVLKKQLARYKHNFLHSFFESTTHNLFLDMISAINIMLALPLKSVTFAKIEMEK